MVSTTIDEAPGGGTRFIMQNNYTQSMTAYAYEFSLLSNGKPVSGSGIEDVLILERGDPIAPGKSAIAVHGIGPRYSNVQYTFRAAIFADGATFGDATWIQHIVKRRQYTINYINDIAVILRGAIANNTGLDALADQLKSQRDGRWAAADQDLDQQMSITKFWDSTLRTVNNRWKSGSQTADDVVKMHLNILEQIRKKLTQSLPVLKQNQS
jgi:hypothetical protein